MTNSQGRDYPPERERWTPTPTTTQLVSGEPGLIQPWDKLPFHQAILLQSLIFQLQMFHQIEKPLLLGKPSLHTAVTETVQNENVHESLLSLFKARKVTPVVRISAVSTMITYKWLSKLWYFWDTRRALGHLNIIVRFLNSCVTFWNLHSTFYMLFKNMALYHHLGKWAFIHFLSYRWGWFQRNKMFVKVHSFQ